MTLRDQSEAVPWRVLTVVVPQAVEDEIAAVLGGGSLGVEIAAAGTGTSALRVYLGAGDDGAAWSARAQAVLAAHGVAPPADGPTIEPVGDDRWVERWQASLAPIPLGERFIVLPNGGVWRADGRVPIVLVPGMAFGTGEHETTRMCARALEDLIAQGSRWLDLGTGTGILAIVAVRSGASRALALDLDAEAAHVAAEVVAANNLGDRIEVRAGSIADRDGESFDGIVANIQSSFFLGHAKELAEALVDGGWLVISGVLEADLPEIESALSSAGLLVRSRNTDGPWACLVARSPHR